MVNGYLMDVTNGYTNWEFIHRSFFIPWFFRKLLTNTIYSWLVISYCIIMYHRSSILFHIVSGFHNWGYSIYSPWYFHGSNHPRATVAIQKFIQAFGVQGNLRHPRQSARRVHDGLPSARQLRQPAWKESDGFRFLRFQKISPPPPPPKKWRVMCYLCFSRSLRFYTVLSSWGYLWLPRT